MKADFLHRSGYEVGMGTVKLDEDTELSEELQEPGQYGVYLINDDYTTMDFVIEVLMKVFHKSALDATRLMYTVHRAGKGLAGVYTWDIASTKADTVHKLAREQGHPLRCSVDKV
jgi:ATP-dependent Clp protease adaptor protein ClpS